MGKQRRYELDILRCVGTLVIIFHHLSDYAGNFYDLHYFGIPINLSYVNTVNTYLGLGIFVFVSGFVLEYTRPRIDSMLSFLKRRAVRILPLYFVALGLFMMLYPRLSLSETIIHILGWQILLAPRFVTPLSTLWFIGLLVILYGFYAFLARFARSWRGLFSFSAIAFGLFLLTRIALGIVEYRFFVYFPVFLAGILTCRTRLFDRRAFGIGHIVVAVLVLCGAVLAFRYSHYGSLTGEVTEEMISQASVVEILMTSLFSIVMMLAFIFVVFVLAKRLAGVLGRAAVSFLSFISFSSYSIYLFHRPVLAAMAGGFSFLPFYRGYWRLILLLVLGLPVILLLSYLAQSLHNWIVERLRLLT